MYARSGERNVEINLPGGRLGNYVGLRGVKVKKSVENSTLSKTIRFGGVSF
jgi:hypothetical protein